MHFRNLFLVLFLVVAATILIFFNSGTKEAESSLQPLSIVFDWTPNTNHTGIYVALHEKWYEEEGIDLKILPYPESVSPDVLVSSGAADVGISSTESVVASHAAGAPVISIAAIIAHNTSSLVVRADSGIVRPRELDGKIYGGYGAPYEEAVINSVIKNDGGKGDFKNVTLGVDALEALRSKRIDFVWIFDAWQGIQAKREGLELTTFALRDHGIPDYSTPNIITSPEILEEKKEALRKFMKATARGYEYARLHPRESAEMLISEAPPGTFPDTDFVFESQEYLSQRYADPKTPWGFQSESAWRDYPLFMLKNRSVFDAEGRVVSELNLSALYTNEFLP